MVEWFKAHAWKVCVPLQVPWVRIPLSPPIQNKMDKNKTTNQISWRAPEFPHYEKDVIWFTILSVIAAGLFLWALFTKNLIFALLIAISFFSIMTYALKKPAKVDLAITPRGVKINKTIYDFDSLKSFWIFYELPEIKEVSLRSKKKIMPYIKIPLGEQNPVEIRRILIKYLPERKHRESLIDNLARALRF